MVSGQLMYFWIPMVSASPEYSELFSQEPVGRINYSYVYQSICIKYGKEVTEPTYANPWAQVLPEHLKDLFRLGEAVWESNYLTHRPIRGVLSKEEE
jgi:hypothetical protein